MILTVSTLHVHLPSSNCVSFPYASSETPHHVRSKWVKSWPKELRLSTAAKMPRSVQRLQLNLDLEPRRRWGEFLGQVPRLCFFRARFRLNVFRYLFVIFSLCGCCEHIIHHLHLYDMYLEPVCRLF